MRNHYTKTHPQGEDWARERLRNYLDMHPNLPRERFAKVAEISPSTVAHFLEGAEISPVMLRRIARARTTPYEQLLKPISNDEYKKIQEAF